MKLSIKYTFYKLEIYFSCFIKNFHKLFCLRKSKRRGYNVTFTRRCYSSYCALQLFSIGKPIKHMKTIDWCCLSFQREFADLGFIPYLF